MPDCRKSNTVSGIAVHYWDASDSDSQTLLPLLSNEERQGSGKMVTERLRQEYIVHRAVRRLVLGEALDCEPTEIEYETGEHGRPALQREGPDFNLAHCGPVGIMALSFEAKVGIDLEARSRSISQPLALADRFFAPAEKAWIESHGADSTTNAFLRLWVHKEALLKCMGTGVQGGLEHDLHLIDGALLPRYSPVGMPGFQICELSDLKDHAVALAWSGSVCGVTVLPFPMELL